MDKVIAVFHNRNQAMQFSSYLKRMGIQNKTINTPRELSVSCGISVVFSGINMKDADFLVKRYRFGGFDKFYRIISNGFSKKYLPI